MMDVTVERMKKSDPAHMLIVIIQMHHLGMFWMINIRYGVSNLLS